MAPDELTRRTLVRRAARTSLAVAVGPALLAACGDDGDGGSGGEIRIGLLTPTAGPAASTGADLRNGFKFYLAENDNRIAGHPVKLIEEDEGAAAPEALARVRKLILRDRVHVITGINLSTTAIAVRDFITEHNVPMIVSLASADDITHKGSVEYVFRTSFSSRQLGESAAQWIHEDLGKGRVFSMAPDYAAGQEIVSAFQGKLRELGGTPSGELFTPFGSTSDFQPYLSRARRARPDAVFAYYGGGEAVEFVKQYASFGLKDQVPLMPIGAVVDDGVLPAQGKSAVGIESNYPYSPQLDTSENKDFIARLEKRMPDVQPSFFVVTAYDAGTLLAQALKKAPEGLKDGPTLARALADAGEVASPRGAWTLDPKTHDPVQTVYLRRVEMGDDGPVNSVVREIGKF